MPDSGTVPRSINRFEWCGVLLLTVLLLSLSVYVISISDSNQEKSSVPTLIDVILVDRQRGREVFQIRNIQKYMPWVHKILVFKLPSTYKQTKGPYPLQDTETSTVPVEYIMPLEDQYNTLEKLTSNLSNIQPNMSEHFIFLGDTTLPIQSIVPEQFFSPSQKLRMFNYLLDATVSSDFRKYYEDTMPVMLLNNTDLKAAESLDFCLFSYSITEKLLYSPFINDLIILTANEFTDNQQLSKITAPSELFQTILIPDTFPETSRKKLNKVVCTVMRDKK